MIFNPSKCAFGILREVSWLHGVPARDRGQPEKVQVVLDMQSLGNTKQLQQLTRRITALNRFISQSTDKSPGLQHIEECLHLEQRMQ